ncbi:MAG: hypothetical protein OCD76_14820 [Reichenbachiella sp.]
MKYIYLALILTLASCSNPIDQYRLKVDLQGQWQFSLDTAKVGIDKNWFHSDLNDSINLPGTTDSNQKGFINEDTTTMHLNRRYKYEGAAWYRKSISVPDNFENKHIELFIERTKTSKVWIDSTLVGGSQLLQALHQIDVTQFLTPGLHYITVMVNNDLRLTPYGNVHIYSDDTQTNWNGLLGKLYLEASAKTYISNLQVVPDLENKKIDITLEIENQLNVDQLDIELNIEKTINGKTTKLKSKKVSLAYQPEIQLSYSFEDSMALWDEYEQPIYHLTAVISSNNIKDAQTVDFGLRNFSVNETQFSINGRNTFLRGKHEAAVFPMTGYPPMNVEDWVRVYKIAKSYGINHYRFHTYCPPEAAFIAADQEGIYLQAELPFWGGLDSDEVAMAMKEEGLAMLKAYANHPSFVMFSPGNEIWGGHDKMREVMLALKEYDGRPLYTMGSNNNIGYMRPQDYVEFFVGARIPENGGIPLGHTRLTHAFADSKDGGILNTQAPSTEGNFNYAVANMDLPVISHEIGQYQIYPDYNEIEKYTGVVNANNLKIFQEGLIKAGMADMDSIFQKASGAWSALCYKAEMEAALRTEGMAGFQLLDLQDFPGQGTALVGILDAFMDSKEVVTPAEWKQSCNDVVLLAEFSKYCWTNDESFATKIKIANYSNDSINNEVIWKIKRQDGTILDQGVFSNLTIINGGNSTVGEIKSNLSEIINSEKLKLDVTIPNTEYSNTYPIWVYPSQAIIKNPNNILVAEKFNNEAISKLIAGAKVLLFPQTEDISQNSVAGHFPPDFWNYGMFKTISENVNKPVSPGTLGLLTNPNHPIFNSFPTDYHTNWQWFSIIKESNSLLLNNTTEDYRPIVQVIDNLERNHKLGMIFEFKVGEGKLLVCTSQLNKLTLNAGATQLYQSIINYMGSEEFTPSHSLTIKEMKTLLTKSE